MTFDNLFINAIKGHRYNKKRKSLKQNNDNDNRFIITIKGHRD